MFLRLQPYNFRVIYKSGLTNEAEYLSRHQIDITTKWSSKERIAEEYINYIVQHTIPKSLTSKEIQQETKKTVLQKVQKPFDTRKRDIQDKYIQPYKKFILELQAINQKIFQ